MCPTRQSGHLEEEINVFHLSGIKPRSLIRPGLSLVTIPMFTRIMYNYVQGIHAMASEQKYVFEKSLVKISD
jgi:hypothetical protein